VLGLQNRLTYTKTPSTPAAPRCTPCGCTR
jgi:hypothetical protein